MHTAATDRGSTEATAIVIPVYRAATAILCLVVMLPLAAAAEKRPLWGYGVRGCSDYLLADEAKKAGDAAEFQRYEDWLTGFISGLNLATGDDVLRGSGIESAMRHTRAHCDEHTDDDFFNAAMGFVRSLANLK